MASFLSVFTAAQLDILGERAELTEKQAVSTTGTIVQGDDIGEFYLDDDNAQFLTNGVTAGDIIEFTAGPILSVLTPPQTQVEYGVAGPYFDPIVQATDQIQSETRIILDGYPTVGGPVTYRVLSPTPILEELVVLNQNRSFLENVRNPELQELDALFLNFVTKFDVVNNLVADVHRALAGTDRTRIDATLLNNSALATVFTELFPDAYFELEPARTTAALGVPAGRIDTFNVPFAGSEYEGSLEEEAEEALMSDTDPLTVDYNNALNKEEAALLAQQAGLVALQAEIADNDTPAESGDLNVFYTALSAEIAAQLASITNRLNDITEIRTNDRSREDPTASHTLTFATHAAVQAEILSRSSNLQSPPFSTFLDLRYPYLDLLSNRGYGTRTELLSNQSTVNFSAQQRQTLLDERTTDRDLLQLP